MERHLHDAALLVDCVVAEKVRNRVVAHSAFSGAAHDPRSEVDDAAARLLAASLQTSVGSMNQASLGPSLEGGETPVGVVRQSVLGILTHIMLLTSEVLSAKTNVVTEQIRRLRELRG